MNLTQIETQQRKSNYSAFYQERTHFTNNRPDYFNLKAVVRDEFGILKVNCVVCIQINIYCNHLNSKIIYSEAHPLITNSSGYIELSVGLQNPSEFKEINWMQGPYFMQIVVDGYELVNKVLVSIF